MIEKRVFTKSAQMQFVDVNNKHYDSVIHEFVTKTSPYAKHIPENSLIYVDFNDSQLATTSNLDEKKYYRVYLSQTHAVNDDVLYLDEDSINNCTRKYIGEHLETALFEDIVKLNKFLTEHNELNFENTKIQPFGNDLLLTYVNIGDEGKPWAE